MNAKTPTSKTQKPARPARAPFGGRTVLRVSEMARHLKVTEERVVALIDSGLLPAINVGLRGRKFWRVTVENFEGFLRKRDL